RVLQRVQLPISGETLNSPHVSSAALQRQNQAGEHGLAVQQHGARAAFSQLATVLRSCMAKVLPQDLQQCFVRREEDVELLAIQSEPDLRRLLGFNWECRHFPSPLACAL